MVAGPEQIDHVDTIDLDDDLVVYDFRRHQVHVLAPLQAFIWESCDGRHSIDDLMHLLVEADPGQISLDMAASAVVRTLQQITNARLLKRRG